MNSEMVLLAGNSVQDLAESIAMQLATVVSKAEVKRFSDDEISVEIEANVRGRDVFIIQSTSQPANDHLMELLIMADACKRASAGRITAVIPYYGYARQDRKVRSRAPITAKLVADMISVAGISRVLTMDLHAGQIQGFFNAPVDNLFASGILSERMKEILDADGVDSADCVIVSPDAGGAERARYFARKLRAEMAIIDKRREQANHSEVMNVVGNVEDKVAIIVDDLADTAGTLCKAAAALKLKGATSVYACCTHPVLSGPAIERIVQSDIMKILVTDTINLDQKQASCAGKIEIVSSASLFAAALEAIHKNASISRLFL